MNAIAISANTRAVPAKKSVARSGYLLSSRRGIIARTRDTVELLGPEWDASAPVPPGQRPPPIARA